MSNLILWVHQCTVDYTYQVGHGISEIMKKLRKSNEFPELNEIFEDVQKNGLPEDRTVNISGPKYGKPGDVAKKLGRIAEVLNGLIEEKNRSIQIGGNPAIGAIRGFFLRHGFDTKLPMSYYIGLYPDSVKNAVESGEIFGKQTDYVKQVFKQTVSVKKAKPQTIGIETPNSKLMLIYGPGRKLSDVAPDGNFRELFKLMDVVLTGAEDSRAVLAITTPSLRPVKIGGKTITELELCRRMIEQFKKSENGERIRIFMSTRSMKGNSKYAHDVLETLKLPHIDIISMSDDEVSQLYTAHNDDKNSDEPLAYKVRGLPFNAIKVCHSADGVIMDLGCIPETIITSESFHSDPAGFLEECLRLSADGATYAMDATAGLGRSANEAMIRIYSKNVRRPDAHQDSLFDRTFLNVTEPMPAGMISVSSAQVVRTRGAVVGVGAIFDGLLLSFIMRD